MTREEYREKYMRPKFIKSFHDPVSFLWLLIGQILIIVSIFLAYSEAKIHFIPCVITGMGFMTAGYNTKKDEKN